MLSCMHCWSQSCNLIALALLILSGDDTVWCGGLVGVSVAPSLAAMIPYRERVLLFEAFQFRRICPHDPPFRRRVPASLKPAMLTPGMEC